MSAAPARKLGPRAQLALPPAATEPTRAGAPSADEVLTVDEGAKLLRVGRNQLYEAIGRGTVPHMRIGRSIRLLRSALVRSLSRSW
jgi:excisionase family DNA binding protein